MKRIEIVANILSQRKILEGVCQDKGLLESELERLVSVADIVTDPKGKFREKFDSLLVTFRWVQLPVGSRINFNVYLVGHGEACFTLASTFAGPVVEHSDFFLQDNPELMKSIIEFLESEAESFDPDWLKIKTKKLEARTLTRAFPDAILSVIDKTGVIAPTTKGLFVDLSFKEGEETPACAHVLNHTRDSIEAEMDFTFKGKTLVEYSGHYGLPKEVITALKELGFEVDLQG